MRSTLATLLVLIATAAAAGDATKSPANPPPAAPPAAKAAATPPPETAALPDSKGKCANPNALGVARTVEIDTTGGPGFGFDHYKAYDFLQDKEVVLTFDDGPQVNTTKAILDALDTECTKAIFFSLGKMAIGLPEIIRDVAHRGHTVGTHTWSHQDMRKKTDQEAKDEIEKGISGVRRAVGGPISPFFRYPYLRDSQATLAHLASRNIAMFSTDVDSFDFKRQTPEQLVQATMKRLDKKGKGIILMHDIQPHTAKALPALLAALKAGGYKVVQMKAKDDLKTLAEYDAMIEKDVKGLPAVGAERPLSSVVKTVPTGK
ncbi:polysaccharide deacetylase family protein [Hyphomicrobium sp.]|uniref:polysaccharide deacetylase family protein n=1 Tax=Hyphomicrobium sp. TaxID=82 RepID=UPI002E3459E1|nr:polysaccharide deacetylase family protein [Hyphomicrobium sp.]HEX2843515.1 polysaccharide deacetylase family protein [Hyphomicrobium sp.]